MTQINSPPGIPGWAQTLINQINQALVRITGRSDRPFRLPTFTVSTLPTAADWRQCLIYVSDGTSNKRLAVSDGTNWRFPDGNIVS